MHDNIKASITSGSALAAGVTANIPEDIQTGIIQVVTAAVVFWLTKLFERLNRKKNGTK